MEMPSNRENSTEELSEKITRCRHELDSHQPGDSERYHLLKSLSSALWDRFERDRGHEDLDECIAIDRETVRLLPEDHPKRPQMLFNLALSIQTRFDQSGKSSDLEESISSHRLSLEILPPGHPDRSSASMNLANALLARFMRNGEIEDLEDGIRSLKSGADHEFSPSFDRLRTADRWARIARENNHPTCLAAYETAISLLEASLNVAPTLEMQHRLLVGSRGFPSLALDAAAFAIDRGDLVRAVEFLEQGRALLWMQMRGLRATLDDLAEVNQDLASTFMDVSQKLEAFSTNTSSKATLSGSDAVVDLSDGFRRLDGMIKQSRLLSEERKKIISEIRLVPGFEDFQRPASFAKLRQAADEGPVIIVNLSKYRSDAIIVLRDRYPLLVSLSNDNPHFHEEIFDLHESLLIARRDSLKELPRNYEKILRSELETLWRLVVSNVVGKLNEIGIPKGSRIWWCPTSVLQSLPLHVAGEWRIVKGRVRRYCTHKYISSYTPSLNALVQARLSFTSSYAHGPSLLFVGQEDEGLQCTSQERGEMKLGDRDEHLIGAEATHDKILDGLHCHAWALERLTLLDIVRARPRNAELAFLAACHTAEQTEGSAHDEVLHIAAGMQFCGFRNVIGTLWAMLDENGPAFARTFYKYMAADDGMPEKGFKRSARALHAATRELRLRKEVSLESWVNFVHIGA